MELVDGLSSGAAPGFIDGTFAPNNPTTIAEFLSMTTRLAEIVNPPGLTISINACSVSK
ncbi:MAG: hypothetical protein FWC70_13040 [Defluviitaleaceae bacterium]|nr:hypothetical protein [Defluviitaleaceae bacterium]